MFHTRRWTIIPYANVTESMVNDCLETSLQTLRKSLDGTQTFLKWEGTAPAWVSSMGLTELTHSEILEILGTEVWTEPVPRPE